ncbi:uncharacterized protein M421DRAFT_37847, partial [Didymella exigua CBS 183.55]
NMTDIEEQVIFQRILRLNEQRFMARLSNVEDIAGFLPAKCHQPLASRNWASMLFRRQTEVKIKVNR